MYNLYKTISWLGRSSYPLSFLLLINTGDSPVLYVLASLLLLLLGCRIVSTFLHLTRLLLPHYVSMTLSPKMTQDRWIPKTVDMSELHVYSLPDSRTAPLG